MTNTNTPQTFTPAMLKNIIECMSKDVTRPILNGCVLRVEDTGICSIASIDGHMGVRYFYLCITSVRELFKTEFGVNLKEVDGRAIGKEYVLFPEPKRRKKVNKLLIEPDEVFPNIDRVIPDLKTAQCDVKQFPLFCIDTLQRVAKITGGNLYLPDYWNHETGCTVKELDDMGSILFVMPSRVPKDWKHFAAWDNRANV